MNTLLYRIEARLLILMKNSQISTFNFTVFYQCLHVYLDLHFYLVG